MRRLLSPSFRPCSTGIVRWRKSCVHLAGLAFFFHFVSCVEMLVQAASLDAGGHPRGRVAAGLCHRRPVLPCVVALRRYLAWNLCFAGYVSSRFWCPRWARIATFFPRSGVRISWLIAHIAALLAAYVALGFSLLASVLYLIQERRLKSKHKPGEDSWWLPLDWLPPLDTLERIAHATLEFGFPCMTVGLVIGSVLAQETLPGRGLLP